MVVALSLSEPPRSRTSGIAERDAQDSQPGPHEEPDVTTLEQLIGARGCPAILTMEVQRGVIGDLAALRPLADVVDEAGMIPNIAALLAVARRQGTPVVHCRAVFRHDRAGSFRNVPMVNRMLENPDHLLLGSPQAELVPELGPGETDLDSARMHGMSPFFGTALDPMLRSAGVATVIATGVSLNVGIPGMVIEAINRGYHVVIPTDCVVGYPPEYGQAVLANSLARITTLTTSKEILDIWG